MESNNQSTAAVSEEQASWTKTHLPTFLRLWQDFYSIPPMPKPLATVVLAILGILGVAVFITLVSFAVNITMRP